MKFEKIISIKPVGKRKAYDVELDHRHKGYFANGFQTHNSGGDVRADFSIADAFDAFEDGKTFKRKYPKVSRIAISMEGQLKSAGRHACAMVVAASDLRSGENASLAIRKKVVVGNWDKEDAEYMGLMKLDVLGLNALTVLNECKKLIKKRHKVELDYDTLDIDDPKIYKEFNEGHGVGVFQFASHGMMKLCREVGVEDFEELIALNALHRPGTLRSGLTHKYHMRKHGIEKVSYIHPLIKDITERTQGIILYQEQVMAIMYWVGGLPWKTTDMIRKVVSKSKGEEQFLKFKKMFIQGCLDRKTVSAEDGEKIFSELQYFGSYGFNRAHAAEYATIAAWEMWLKVHYPTEYMVTILTYGSDDKKAEHIQEARRLGLKLLLPDINKSGATEWIPDDNGNLLIPIKEIKGVGEVAANEIILKRKPARFRAGVKIENLGGPYKDVEDMETRAIKRKVNSRVVKLLEKTHCFGDSDEKLKIGEIELDELSKCFNFSLSNDPMYRYRKMIELIKTQIKLEPLSALDFSREKYRYHFGRMSILKFGYKEDKNVKMKDVRGTAGDLGGVYGNYEDDTDFSMIVFGREFYKANKYAIEHCQDKWLLVKAKSMRSNNIHTSELWFGEDLMAGKADGLGLELVKTPEYTKSYDDDMKRLLDCKDCELRNECTKPVLPSKGQMNVMLFGEAPGKNEDKYGRGFYESAKSGKLMWKEFDKYGLERSMFHITNIVKCYPSETRTPKRKHIKICKQWIDKEIATIKPAIILAFGNTAVKFFTDDDKGIFGLSGTTVWDDNYNCYICWCAHPASAVYQHENKIYFDKGVENFARTLNSVGLGG